MCLFVWCPYLFVSAFICLFVCFLHKRGSRASLAIQGGWVSTSLYLFNVFCLFVVLFFVELFVLLQKSGNQSSLQGGRVCLMSFCLFVAFVCVFVYLLHKRHHSQCRGVRCQLASVQPQLPLHRSTVAWVCNYFIYLLVI